MRDEEHHRISKEHGESVTGGEEMDVMNERSVECPGEPMRDQ